jgi:hypothetical protein
VRATTEHADEAFSVRKCLRAQIHQTRYNRVETETTAPGVLVFARRPPFGGAPAGLEERRYFDRDRTVVSLTPASPQTSMNASQDASMNRAIAHSMRQSYGSTNPNESRMPWELDCDVHAA